MVDELICSCGVELQLTYHSGEGWRLDHIFKKELFPFLDQCDWHMRNNYHTSLEILRDLRKQDI